MPEPCRNKRQLLTTRNKRPEAQTQQPQHSRGLLLSTVTPPLKLRILSRKGSGSTPAVRIAISFQQLRVALAELGGEDCSLISVRETLFSGGLALFAKHWEGPMNCDNAAPTTRRAFLQSLALGSLLGTFAACKQAGQSSRAQLTGGVPTPSGPPARDLISSPEQALDVFELEAVARSDFHRHTLAISPRARTTTRRFRPIVRRSPSGTFAPDG